MRLLSRALLFCLGIVSAVALPARAQTYPVTITNSCDYQIYVLGTPQSGDRPYTTLTSTQSTVYTLNLPSSVARIYGCWNDVTGHFDDPVTLAKNCAWVELTVGANGNLFSNITYVDYISIPMAIAAGGGFACIPATSSVTTFFDESTVQQQCPTKLAPSLTTPSNDKACMSPFHLCSDSDGRPGDPSCTLFDSIISTCVTTPSQYPGCAGGSGTNTVDVYGCRPTTFWSTTAGEPFCMAINRGILPSYADQSNPSTFYPANGTFNAYGAFIHKHLPGAGPVFAISFDDYPSTLNQGGYVNCQTSTSYSINFCNSSAAAARVAMKGAFTRVPHNPSKSRIEVTGSFAPTAPIDLAREKLLLEAVLDETAGAGELVSGRGPGSTPFPLALFRRPDSDGTAAVFETAEDVSPAVRARLVKNRSGRYDFSLSIREAQIKLPESCQTDRNAKLTTRFTLQTAALEVAREEFWGCSDGRTFRFHD